MRTVIVNFTGHVPHVGCKIVSDRLLEQCARVGLYVEHIVPVGQQWQTREHHEALSNTDVVLVNGEGTLHHGYPRARRLAAIAPFCKRHDVPAFLINTVYQSNGWQIAQQCRDFVGVFAREPMSWAEMRAQKISAEVVPDLTLASKGLFEGSLKSEGMLVTDSVDSDHAAALRRVAKVCPDTRFVALQDRTGIDKDKILRLFGGAESVLTGRFHGVCLAVLARKPFMAVPSNSWKIEGLLDQLGMAYRLEPMRYRSKLPLEWTSKELLRLENFLVSTRNSIDAMFDKIKDTVS